MGCFVCVLPWCILEVLCAQVQDSPVAGEKARGAVGLKEQPTAAEIRNWRLFEEPLVPMGGTPSAEENAALVAALREYSQRATPEDFGSLTAFLEQHPGSPWAASLLTVLGLEYYRTAYYSRALDAWERAWALGRTAGELEGKSLADRAAGETAYMYARLGRTDQLEEFLKSVDARVFVGPATELIAGAREGLWNMQHRPEIAFRCGPLALHRIKRLSGESAEAEMVIFHSASTRKGLSLSQVAELSRVVGLNYQMAFRARPVDFVVPSVVHWKLGHYAAMVRRDGDRFLLEDPTFGNTVWATRAALEAEASGYFLLPPGPLPVGWRSVGVEEGQTIWGRGFTSNSDNKNTAPDDPASDQCGAGGAGGGVPVPYPNTGMAGSRVHLMLVNLNLTDTPVGYAPPVGPAVRFTVRYGHREAYQPAVFTYSNFGPKWTCDWISYITDNPQSPAADVNLYVRGGGTRSFTGFDANTQTFSPQQRNQSRLRRVGPAGYELLSGDGSKMVYAQSDGSTGTSRKVFLTQLMDPFGNTVTLEYDTQLRLTSITDAIGQVTTLAYAHATDIHKITRVTDPFGRFATFAYDTLGRLTNITDVIGLNSTFRYEAGSDFINALVTPYGTNSFTRGGTGTTRWLETLYADGSRDRVEFNQATNLNVAYSDPVGTVPQGMNTRNEYLWYRNTYYWSRTATASSYGDYTKARIYHWLHNPDLTTASGILESTKEPLEGRVWYDYAGQSSPVFVGSTDQPRSIGRVLDDGSTQLYTYGYNEFGNVTNTIDPLGRSFTYLYDTNGIDLLEVRMTRAGKDELLFKATYNAQHLPLTTTDAAGQTTTNAYNARGQLLATTNPKGETTTYAYDTNGFLLAVDGPLPGTNDTRLATYDAFGRVRTLTDADGYTTSTDYDAMDRVTRITFPDGTFLQISYDRLQPSVLQDRAGRQTLLEYDALGNLVKRTDPLGRVTRFQWCNCGDVKSLTDPMGRTTEWQADTQGRLVAKRYGDGSKVSYLYEHASGRLRQIVNEKGQFKQFTYNRDNTLRSVSYPNAVVPTPTVTYAYDPDYLRRVSMTDGVGTTVYSYVPVLSAPNLGAGRLASIDGPYANDTITYAYDELGRRISTAINGVASVIEYDAAGRVTSETNALGMFTYTYDGVSDRLLSEVFPNGLTRTNTYLDNLDDHALASINYRVGATPVSQFAYGRDIPAGRITTWSQQAGAAAPDVFSFGYDAANRLLSAVVTNAGALIKEFVYAYDPADNRLLDVAGGVTNTATYNTLNQISTSTAPAAARTNEWDGENRVVAVHSGDERTEFTYDGASRLASIRHLTNGVEASVRRLLWADHEIREERDAAHLIKKRFAMQGMKIEAGPNAGSYYYARDHLGSIRNVTDSAATVRARHAYDPFGRQTLRAGDIEADFGFAGMFWSGEAELALTWFRSYSPSLGRWLSRDPLDQAEMDEGPNLYAYVRNNPINLIDPLGLSACCEHLREQGSRNWEVRSEKCKRLWREADQACRDESLSQALGLGQNPFGPGRCATARQAATDYCRQGQAEVDKDHAAWQACLKKPCKQSCLAARPPASANLGPRVSLGP